MRQIAREPEQLELEAERERIRRRTLALAGLGLVEQVEEARERLERAGVRLLLGEEAEHRLQRHEADTEPVRVFPRRPVGAQEVDAGDRVQLAAPFVQDELHVAERLEPGAEADFVRRIPLATAPTPPRSSVYR